LAGASQEPQQTLGEMVIVRQFTRSNNRILTDDEPALETTNSENHFEIKIEAEERPIHRKAKVQDVLEMGQGYQNLHATQKESCAQNMQMTAVGHVSGTEEIVKASQSNFQHVGVAAFKLFKRSPLPTALTSNDLPGG